MLEKLPSMYIKLENLHYMHVSKLRTFFVCTLSFMWKKLFENIHKYSLINNVGIQVRYYMYLQIMYNVFLKHRARDFEGWNGL